jgi:bifunctional non-homologous end joining protein LigD
MSAHVAFARADMKSAPSATKSAPSATKSARSARDIHAPMLPTAVEQPFDSPDWLFETKWDGVRAICTVTKSDVRASSRTGQELTRAFPELLELRHAFHMLPIVVDGEIVSLDRKGRSSFQRLQPRINRLSASKSESVKITFVVFDVLSMGAHDVRKQPLEVRKDLLKKAIVRGKSLVAFSPHVIGKGVRLFQKARDQGIEGIIAKRRTSQYHAGRTREWLKIKVTNSQEFVICGWTEPRGSRRYFGSILVGLYDHGELVYTGHAGTGFDENALAALFAKMKPLETKRAPFRVMPAADAPIHWIRPKLVAEVKFGEWTHDGVLRQPVYLGLRVDKRPEDCVRVRERS